MLCKLSISNIKRSFKDYAIYFVTLILGVCIFYIFNSIDSQTAMLKLTHSKKEIIEMLIFYLSFVSVFVSVILGYLIIYASRFLIKKRNKEFGIYMTLGMSKRKISTLLLLETFMIGLISLAIGLGLGIALSQITSIFVADMFEVNMTNFAFNFSKSAMIKTIIYFGVMYFIVMILNTVIISKNKLINLLQASKKQENIKIKNPVICAILFVISIVVLGIAYYMVTVKNEYIFNEIFRRNFEVLLIPIILGTIGTVLFFYSVAGMLLKILSKCHNLYNSNLNTFIIKQISSKINTVVISVSVICIMLFTTLCLLSSALTIKNAFNDAFNKYNPVDLQVQRWRRNNGGDINYNELVENNSIIKNNTKDRVIFNIYGAGGKESNWRFTLTGFILTESDYNKLAKLFNFDTIKLNKDEYAVVANLNTNKYQEKIDAGYSINIFGKNLKPYKKVVDGFLFMGRTKPNNEGFLVVSDDIVKNENEDCQVLVCNYNTDNEDIKEIIRNKFWQCRGMGISISMIDKDWIKEGNIALRVIATFIGLYVGIIFLISSSAVLALKELSDCIDDKNKYRVLRQIGVSEKLINKALFKQTFIFFMLPLCLAVVHTIFGLKFCKSILATIDIDSMLNGSVATFLFLIAIYGVYFIITYLCNKNIIRERS